MSLGELDIVDAYTDYVGRFERIAGPSDFGAFVKHHGRLIRKLRYEEFEPRYQEYHDIARAYSDSVRRGETINDVVVKLLRDRCTELLIESPPELR